MPRSFPLTTLTMALFAWLMAGCQSVGFGIANLGVSAPAATVVYDPQHALALDIYRPAELATGSATRAVPVVLFLYGGSWRRGNRAQYAFVGRRLAQHGTLAIVADYRTFPRARFPGFVEDAAAAVAWTQQHAAEYGGDPQRVFVAGHSAGAQIAALIGTDARYLAPHGLKPRDLAGVIGLSGPYDFDIAGYEDVFGAEALWPRAQAVNFVDGDEPPFLLIHGTADAIVEAKDSQELADKLRGVGVNATLVWLPEAGHLSPLVGLRAPGRVPALVPAIRDFVNGGTSH